MRVLSSWQMTGCHYLSVTSVTQSAARGRRRAPEVSRRITRWCCHKSVRECLDSESWVRISASDPCHLRSHLSWGWALHQEAVSQVWWMKLLDNIQQMFVVSLVKDLSNVTNETLTLFVGNSLNDWHFMTLIGIYRMKANNSKEGHWMLNRWIAKNPHRHSGSDADLGKILQFSRIRNWLSASCLVTSRAKLEPIISAVEGIIWIIAPQDWAGHGAALCCPHPQENDRYLSEHIPDLLCLVSLVFIAGKC